jgi:Na+/glutamate symporter
MNEKQMKNWKKIRKLGFIGFILSWFCAIAFGFIISHFIFGYEWTNIIPTFVGSLIGGAIVQMLFWKRNENKYKEYNTRNIK